MTKAQFNHFDVLTAKKAYSDGKNVTGLLRAEKNIDANTPEIIETAYDLQAGTYIEHVTRNPAQAISYAAELASILDSHIKPTDSMLDIGTGELTTLSLLTNALTNKPRSIYAFDISWSRLYKGTAYAQQKMGNEYGRLTSFVSDIGEIALLDKSINVTTSSHALEPNGGRLKELIKELFRITIDKLVLFEPCFEINSEKGKNRMEELGYIKNVDGIAEELGGKLIDKIKIENASNPLNPTVCFVITPPVTHQPSIENASDDGIFSVPGTNYPLKRMDDFYFSNDTGLCYPVLKGIPTLKSSSCILASALCD